MCAGVPGLHMWPPEVAGRLLCGALSTEDMLRRAARGRAQARGGVPARPGLREAAQAPGDCAVPPWAAGLLATHAGTLVGFAGGSGSPLVDAGVAVQRAASFLREKSQISCL